MTSCPIISIIFSPQNSNKQPVASSQKGMVGANSYVSTSDYNHYCNNHQNIVMISLLFSWKLMFIGSGFDLCVTPTKWKHSGNLYKDILVINTQYMTNATIVSLVKMEYG